MGKEYTRTLSILGLLPIAGSVIFFDDFEHNMNWTKFVGVGDYILELDPNISKQGKQSLHLKTRTTGAATNDELIITRHVHLLPSKVVSLLSNFLFPDYSKILHVMFTIEWYDGINSNISRVKFSPNTPKWEYFDSGGEYQNLPDLAIGLSNDGWHNLQLLCNFSTSKFLSLQVDHLLVDLSAHALRVVEVPADLRLHLTIDLKTIGNNPAQMRIDNIMLHELS